MVNISKPLFARRRYREHFWPKSRRQRKVVSGHNCGFSSILGFSHARGRPQSASPSCCELLCLICRTSEFLFKARPLRNGASVFCPLLALSRHRCWRALHNQQDGGQRDVARPHHRRGVHLSVVRRKNLCRWPRTALNRSCVNATRPRMFFTYAASK